MAGISRASLNMATSRGAMYQRRYREKQKEINQENAAIVAYIKQKYPWIIKEFFQKGKVRVILMKN